jgi:poly(hydroxyalkanoate) depolymerase family esterase
LPVSLAENVEYLRRLRELNGITGFGDFHRQVRPAPASPLIEIENFGSNPGRLKMFAYVPAQRQPLLPLVVVLHGCGQSAAEYDLGAGWSTLAKHYGFALLLPEQQRGNNGHRCFNWFNAEDITRDHGEVCSVRQMIARMVADRAIDPRRIFITGLSAGGAMTMAMLANYPELFAGGAVIAGLPFGVARNVRDAILQMRLPSSRSAEELGGIVRRASAFRGHWPKLSVWHGTADLTVHPDNADEIVKQWLDLHHLPLTPMGKAEVDGYPHRQWWNADGETMVESFIITNMAHGTPLGLAANDKRYGKQGPFLLEAGISSSYHIAKFFGVTDWIRQPKATAESPSAKLIPQVSPVSALPSLSKILWPRTAEPKTVDASPAETSPAEANRVQAKPADTKASETKPSETRPRKPIEAKSAEAKKPDLQPAGPSRAAESPRAARRQIDVAAVINRALHAAGLKK